MSDFTFTCPECNQDLTVDEKDQGMRAPCPNCGKEIDIPSSDAPSRDLTDAGEIAARVTARISSAAGVERLEGFSFREMFSEVFKKHTEDEVERYFINPITKKKESIDDIALEAPSTGIQAKNPSTNGIRRSSYMGRLLATTLVGLLAYTGLQQKAKADMIYDFSLDNNTSQPTSYQPSSQPLNGGPITLNESLDWEIAVSLAIANWNPLNPGDELRVSYNVQNQSDPGDANNLIQFSINAGSNHGVYNASAPSGWTIAYNNDSTIFSGNGDYIPPSGGATFRLFSYNTNTTTGTATAVSDGFTSDPFIPFPDEKEVPIPVIPEPMTIVLMILGGAGASRGLKYYNEHRNKS